jgi:hypothetical protein
LNSNLGIQEKDDDLTEDEDLDLDDAQETSVVEVNEIKKHL